MQALLGEPVVDFGGEQVRPLQRRQGGAAQLSVTLVDAVDSVNSPVLFLLESLGSALGLFGVLGNVFPELGEARSEGEQCLQVLLPQAPDRRVLAAPPLPGWTSRCR